MVTVESLTLFHNTIKISTTVITKAKINVEPLVACSWCGLYYILAEFHEEETLPFRCFHSNVYQYISLACQYVFSHISYIKITIYMKYWITQ